VASLRPAYLMHYAARANFGPSGISKREGLITRRIFYSLAHVGRHVLLEHRFLLYYPGTEHFIVHFVFRLQLLLPVTDDDVSNVVTGEGW